MVVTLLFYHFQFLGRDKEDDGVRRSAVSGKKVRLFANLIKWSLEWSIKEMFCVFGSWICYLYFVVCICRFCWSLINRRRTKPPKVNELNCWNSWMLVMIDSLSLGVEVLCTSHGQDPLSAGNGRWIVMPHGVRYTIRLLLGWSMKIGRLQPQVFLEKVSSALYFMEVT